MPARLVPQSLTGRVFALYAATLIAFLGIGLAVFYRWEFTSELDDAIESAQLLSEVAAPTVTDSVVIGDYDTVKRTLAKTIQNSPFASASFIDVRGAIVGVDRKLPARGNSPEWLREKVAERLADINTVIAVGGRDYGVLRLRFAPVVIADRIWEVSSIAVALAAVSLLAGLVLIRLSLRRWLGPLEGIRQFAGEGSAERGEARALGGAPIEIRETLEAFSRAGAELQVQRVTAAATLNAVADGVITTDGDRRILYANPAAEWMFRSAGVLPGRDIADVVPAAFGGEDARRGIAAWSGKRVELTAESGETLVLDTTLSPIRGAGAETIGHVLACRDITEAQAYEARLRSELETRQAAISSLGGALRQMLPDTRLHELAGSDTDLGSVSRLVARLVQEQRVAHDQLREKEREARKLALIAARTDNAVVLTDALGRVEWVNAGFVRLTGYAAEEIVGRKPGELLQGPGTDPETVRRISERLRCGEGFNEELLNYHKDGHEYWIAVEAQPIFDETGELANFMAIESDITARRAEQQRLAAQFDVASALAASDSVETGVRRMLQVICERLDWQVGQVWRVDGGRLRVIGEWHPEPAAVTAFVEASRTTSLQRGEGVLGRIWETGAPFWLTVGENRGGRLSFHLTQYPPAVAERAAADTGASVPSAAPSAGRAQTAELTFEVGPGDEQQPSFLRSLAAVREGVKSGLGFPVLVRGEVWGVVEFASTKALRPDEALIRSFATIGVQIGEFIVRREAQEAVLRSEERFRSAFDDAHAGLALGKLDTGFLYVNRALCEMLGYTPEELLDRTSMELTHPDDLAATHEAAQRLRTGQADRIEIEKRFVRKDGTAVWLLVRARRQRGADGGPDLLISHFLDITERKAAEQALRREKRLLEDAQRRELRLGHEIQRTLLIGDLPTGIRGAEIAGYAAPSRGIDGDFYAFTTFRPDCFELLVGDVMGKGVPAALVGAALRTTYNQVVTELVAGARGSDGLPGPAAIVNGLHERLTPRLIELDTFVTLALYRFELSRGTLTFVNAGHTPGLLLRADRTVQRVLGENVPVGVIEGERYVEASLPLAGDDLLLVYSDGITEARNYEEEEFGEQRLRGFLSGLGAARVPVRVGLQALRKRVHDYIGERVMLDDETAVMVGRRGPFVDLGTVAGPGEEMLELPWSLAGLEPLRSRIASAAAGLGAEAADRLALAVFEAATNVVRHVRRPFDDATLSCRLWREADRVTVELWYIGPLFEPEDEGQPDFSGASDGGFGMYIMERAVSQVVYEQPALDVCCTRLVQMAADPAHG